MANTNTNPTTLAELVSNTETYGERSRNTTHKQALKNITVNTAKVLFDLSLQTVHTASNVVTAYEGIKIADGVAIKTLLKENDLSTYQREVLAKTVEVIVDYVTPEDDVENLAKVRAYVKGLTNAAKTKFEKTVEALVKSEGITRLEAQLKAMVS